MIRVVIADDFPAVRRSIRALLSMPPDVEVVGEAADGEEAVELVGRFAPDVVVMDVSMPRVDGIQATERLRALGSTARVVAVSMYTDTTLVQSMLEKGAWGFVSKVNLSNELLLAIRAVYDGIIYLCPGIASALDAEE